MSFFLRLLGLALLAPIALGAGIGAGIGAVFTAVLAVLAFPGALLVAISEQLERRQ